MYWGFAEISYYIYFRIRLALCQRRSVPPALSDKLRKQLYNQIRNAIQNTTRPGGSSVDTWRAYVREWFIEEPLENIHRDNILDFLRSSLFHQGIFEEDTESKEIYQEHLDFCNQALLSLETELEYEFKQGFNPNVRFYNISMDPVNAWYRPVAIYLLFFLFRQYSFLSLLIRGFCRKHSGDLTYWIRQGSCCNQSEALVFIHGISPGIGPYLSFLSKIDGSRTMFIVELPFVSMDIFASIPTAKDTARSLDLMLHQHGFRSACFVAHSYGTAVCSWVLRYRPHLAQSLVLIDPISLLLCFANVLSDFIYHRSENQSRKRIPRFLFLILFKFISAREIGIAETLCRNFWWYEAMTFAEDLPRNTSVILSENDRIVPVSKITQYLKNWNDKALDKPIRVMVQRGMMHGGFLFSRKDQLSISEIISRYH